MLLLIPTAIFLLIFVVPLGSIISLSLENTALGSRFVTFNAAAENNPDQRAQAVLQDLGAMDQKQLGEVARMLNQEKSGFRSLILDTGKKAKTIPPSMGGLVAFDKRWAEPDYWEIISKNAGAISWRHYQKVSGLKLDAAGNLTIAKGDLIFMRVMGRTLVISVEVTLLTLLISYPVAFAVARGSRRTAATILTIVMVSFWTSVLVRTTAWVVLLQTNGLINNLLVWLGIVREPIQLIFNRFGALVAMTHVLLPFAILPMINVMRTIPKAQSDASRSLGAGPIETFLRVYFPQTLRGVAVGGGTVFILALGFYITPALTGGPNDQMLAYFIADFVNKTLNWGMAAALSVLLLLIVILLICLGKLIQRMLAKRERAI
ncbi:ABC transporter permease [Mycoplana dimorpha]|uniref:ABC transporter permease n=1 Tax=Mycoplana dimorpha TaxID=28320 RepID=UPI00147510AE